jgi:outer membrane protein TolC
VPPASATVHLTLRDAVAAALENSLDLEIARTNPEVAAEQLLQARGVYDPTMFLDHGFGQRETPTFSFIQNIIGGTAVTRIEEDEWLYSGGLTGVLPLGLSYSSGYELRRLSTSSVATGLDPEWRGDWVTEVRLPLLRDLFRNQASITVNRAGIAFDLSEEEFRRELMDLVVRVEGAYWELASARAAREVSQKSLQTAQDLLEQTRIQYEVGVVSRVEVTQAEAGLAQREVDAIVSVNRAEAAQDELLNLILVPTMEQYDAAQLTTDEPTFIEYQVDPDAALATALQLRPELAAAHKTIEDAELQLGFARNQRLPRLDLRGSYTRSGLAGDPKNPAAIVQFPRDSSGVDDDFFNASGDRSWAIGARLEIPIGNTTAAHAVIERKIDLRRAHSQLRRQEQGVILDVRNATRQLRNSADAVRAARRREVAAAENLRAEQERLRLGDSTPFLVLEFEEDLAEARRQVIVALQGYRNAITGIERAQGTLLDTMGISVDAEMAPRLP